MARNSAPDCAYFVTKCVNRSVGPVFAASECAKILAGSLIWARDNGWWRLLGFVIMPDHYHVGIGLGKVKTLPDAVRGIDQFVSTRVNSLLARSGNLWQAGYYEHLIRDRADFDTILAYIHRSPVQAGLVVSDEEWPFSTANQKYSGEIDWEWLGPSLPPLVNTKYRFRPDAVPQRFH